MERVETSFTAVNRSEARLAALVMALFLLLAGGWA
jgi:hypothetical protein